MEHFSIDEHLVADTLPVADLGLSRLLLMNDSRFPWLILVPKRPGVTEFHHLSPLDQTMLTFETGEAGKLLQKVTGCDKINIASLGNQVRQLHMHVIARFEGDSAWPGPVWNSGAATAYSDGEAQSMIDTLGASLDAVH